MDDEVAFDAHVAGAAAVAFDLIQRHRRWQPSFCVLLHESHTEASTRDALVATSESQRFHDRSEACSPKSTYQIATGDGLDELLSCGLLRPVYCISSKYTLRLMSFKGLQQHLPNSFAIRALSEHSWVDSFESHLGATPMEKIYHHCVQLLFHLTMSPCLLLHDCEYSSLRVAAIHQDMQTSSMPAVLSSRPQVILWITLLVGLHAKGACLEYFAEVMRAAALGAGVYDWPTARSLCESYAWTSAVTQQAEEFWSIYGPARCASLSTESSFEQIDAWSLTSDETASFSASPDLGAASQQYSYGGLDDAT
ncbi:hypothetical protein MRB53_039240 [Persea americana]|nr:hypothetical protein MRB53_039240 [Persea americana]